ncbi:uncharacterized protein K441DRAFT_196786 [Cenococcum geophilum 1.58]|uniref:uncharacterized protein n=1 Tax=Cenococcum geophilum 1.58 TaxID=794803 RepID=UPI00358F65EE|nr:hypothetical protein K441DRAFT_196786 [Cenococcum geophilum 1.58]
MHTRLGLQLLLHPGIFKAIGGKLGNYKSMICDCGSAFCWDGAIEIWIEICLGWVAIDLYLCIVSIPSLIYMLCLAEPRFCRS